MLLLGLHGKAGAGKDTLADRLVERHGFVKRGFAAPLYEEAAAAFNVTVSWLQDRSRKELEQDELALCRCRDPEFFAFASTVLHVDKYMPRSPRWILERWGTDFRRRQSDRYWVERMADFVSRASQDPKTAGVVVPDVRFVDEARWLYENRGRVVKIVRPSIPDVSKHVSAMPLPDDLIERVVHNVGSISYLHSVADSLIRGAERIAS